LKTLILIAIAAISADAQNSAPDRAKVLRAAADALGMVRWADIGNGNTILPGIDVINTMEFEGSGTGTEYHAALGYNPPAMRVEITRTGAGAPQHSIQTVRENYAWNESEVGAGLVAGNGTATPAVNAVKERLLQLWTLPYGVVKAALAAGDKTTVSTENGATILTIPLTGQLAGTTLKATLDSKNLITRVVTQPDNAETEYSDYADHGQVETNIQSPGHIIQKQGGRTILDIRIKTWEANNPYLVFPIPPNVTARR
jgi:hypothetical protein